MVAAHSTGESAAVGLDHNYVLCEAETETNVLAGGPRTQRLAAVCTDPASGRRMKVTTDAPGVQCFTANYPVFDGSLTGKGGVYYPPHAGVCFETQHWPDCVNKPHFPNATLEPGQLYCHTWALGFDNV